VGCDILAEYWGGREILPAGRGEEARKDAELLRTRCEQGKIGSACMGYALMLKYGTATGKRDGEAAKPYWAKLKEQADLNAFRDGASTEGKAALSKAKNECAAGRARACNQLGWAAYGGVQRDKSIPDAFRGYAAACKLGSGQGCRWAGHLAHAYEEIRNLAESEALLKRSCDGGFPGGCDDLGRLDEMERGGAQALALYQRACQEGSRTACGHAGHRLADPKNRNKDQQKAGIELLKKACEAEDEEACSELGGALEQGKITTKDLTGAVAAYRQSCQGKQEAGCGALARLLGAGKTDACVLQGKPRIDPAAIATLREVCKKTPDAAYCRGIRSCP
jgi:hypothetical protein